MGRNIAYTTILFFSSTIAALHVLAALPTNGFLPNHGQYPDSVLFWCQLPDATVYVTSRGLWFHYVADQRRDSSHVRQRGSMIFFQFPTTFHRIQPAEVRPFRLIDFRHAHPIILPAYSTLWLQDTLTHVQLQLSIHRNQLSYQWFGQIPETLWHIAGVDQIEVSSTGLILHTRWGTIQHTHLIAFDHQLTAIDSARFAVVQNTISVQPLPPSMVWLDPIVSSTFLGGNGNDQVTDILQLPNGRTILIGETSSSDLPFHPGSYDTTLSQPSDGFIALFSKKLELQAVALIGGTGSDRLNSITMANGLLYVLGTTNAADLPTSPSAFQPTYGGGSSDAFLFVIDTNLSQRIFSSYVGGSSGDEGQKVLWNGNQLICLIDTRSDDLPTSTTALYPTLQGATDVYILLLSAQHQPLWRSYFGGNGVDALSDALLDQSTLWLTGKTSSRNFPLQTPIQSQLNGAFDAFLTAINLPSSALRYSTLLGGSNTDYSTAVDIAPHGLLLCGVTTSDDFPITAGAIDSSYNGGDDIWLAVIDPNRFALRAATYLGTQGWEQPTDIRSLPDSSSFLIGWTSSTQFPITPDADQSTLQADLEGFIVQLDSFLTTLIYSSYYGGEGSDKPQRISLRPEPGIVLLVAGNTTSAQLPGSQSATPAAVGNIFLSVFQFPILITEPDTLIAVCAGDTIKIRWKASAHRDSFALQLVSSSLQIPIGTIAASDSLMQWTIPFQQPGDTLFYIAAFDPSGRIRYAQSRGGILWYQAPTITRHPTDQQVCPGSDVLFEAAGSGYPPPQRVWERSFDGGKSWHPIPYERGWQLFLSNVGPSQDGALFRLRLYNECGTITSQPAQLKLRTAPVISFHPTTQQICPGDSAIFFASAYPYDSLRWQRSFDGGSQWFNIPNATEEFLTLPDADTIAPTTLFRAIFFYRDCYVSTRPASIRLVGPPQIHQLPTLSAQCPGAELVLPVEASNTKTYRWEQWNPQIQDWELIYFENDAQLRTVANGKPGDTLYFRVHLIGQCDTTISPPISVILLPETPWEIQPPALQFGTLSECLTQTTQTLLIINHDTVAHTLTAIDQSDPYELLTSLPLQVGPADTAILRVRFVPRQYGIFSDTLWLRYSPCEYRIPIRVEGNKLQPLQSSSRFLDFGDQALCFAPFDSLLSVRNSSPSDTLWIQAIVVERPFQTSVTADIILPPLHDTTFSIRFRPSTAGNFNQQLLLIYQIHGCTDTLGIPLIGHVWSPPIQLSSSIITLDTLSHCTLTTDTTIHLWNPTQTPLWIQLTSPMAHIQPEAFQLLPQDTLAVSIQLTPPAGNWSTLISATFPDCPDTARIQISGFRHRDSVTMVTPSIPTLPPATRWVDTIIIRNVGTVAGQFQSATLSRHTLFQIQQTIPALPATIAVGDTLRIIIEFFALDTLHFDTVHVSVQASCPFILSIPLVGKTQFRPVATWSVAPLEGAPGDTVLLRIYGTISPTLQQLQPVEGTLHLRWNATVLTPVVSRDRQLPMQGWSTIALSFPYQRDSVITLQQQFVVGLGDMEYSPILIDSVSWQLPDQGFLVLPQQYTAGTFHLRTYTDGQPQLLNPTPGTLQIAIYPEPINQTSTIEVSGIQFPQLFHVQIYSLLGQLLLDLPSSSWNWQYDSTTERWSATQLINRQQIQRSGILLLRCTDGTNVTSRFLIVQ